MTFSLFTAPAQEPSQFVGFGGNVIDRQAEHRSDDVTEKALAQSNVRLMLLRNGRCYLRETEMGLEPYFRLSTATSMEVLEDGCNRIEKACKALR